MTSPSKGWGEKALAALVAAGRPLSTTEIRQAIGCAGYTISAVLGSLERAGRIARAGKKRQKVGRWDGGHRQNTIEVITWQPAGAGSTTSGE